MYNKSMSHSVCFRTRFILVLRIKPTSYEIPFFRTSMVMSVLWAELWSVVARCNLAGNVGILQQNYFDKLDTQNKKGGTFCLLIACSTYIGVPT